MERLTRLISLCKCAVSVDVNSNRNFYQTIEDYLKLNIGVFDDLDGETIQKMIELNTCINVQFYPKTPIGFVSVWHYDLEMAVDECLAFFELNK